MTNRVVIPQLPPRHSRPDVPKLQLNDRAIARAYFRYVISRLSLYGPPIRTGPPVKFVYLLVYLFVG